MQHIILVTILYKSYNAYEIIGNLVNVPAKLL